jgi:membrane protease YdiL (CAAX protease family)
VPHGTAEPAQQSSITIPTIVALVLAIAAIDVAIRAIDAELIENTFRVVAVVALLFWARRFARLSWTDLGCARADVGAGLRLGALVALAIGVVMAVLVLVPESSSYFEDSAVAHDSTGQRVLEPLVYIPIGTVLFEELIFRGVLLGVLLRGVASHGVAILASAVIFGLWHLPNALGDASGHGLVGGAGIVTGTIAATTVAGVLFAYLRVRSGSLVAPVLAHVATNSFAYIGAVIAIER